MFDLDQRKIKNKMFTYVNYALGTCIIQMFRAQNRQKVCNHIQITTNFVEFSHI